MKLFLLSLFLPLTLAAQNVTNIVIGQKFSVGTNVSNVISGGGGGGFTLLASTVKGSVNGDNVITDPINTVGATLIVYVVSSFNNHAAPTDSQSETWNLAVTGGSSPQTSIYYCVPTTTSASHFFTNSLVNTFPTVAVFAFSGGSGVLDKTSNSGADGSGSTIQPGSITPVQNSELIISGFTFNTGTTATVNSGFSTPLKAGFTSGQCIGGASAYLIQGTAASVNPTWTQSGASSCMSAIASFK